MTVETNAGEFAKQVRRYAAVFGRNGNLGEVIKDRAKHLAIELYNATRSVAPTQAQIAADVAKQGWKIPKTFPDGRMGRGEPSQWASTAVSLLPKKRGRKSKARLQQEAQILSAKPTLEMMQAFVIKHRSAHIGYVATGWLAAIEDLGGSPSSADHSRGGATFKEGFLELNGEVDITNSTPGIIEVNNKHGVVEKAISVSIAYMGEEIRKNVEHELKAA